MELYQHLALVKNLRGIIYFNPALEVKKEIDWLKKKFKYRDLGIGKTLAEKSKLPQIFKVLDLLKERRVEIEAIKLASAFVSPLIVLKEKSLKDFEDLIIEKIKIKEKLNDRELKRNLRLINYSITDFYQESIELAKKKDLKGRKELIKKDLKRFWRLKFEKRGKAFIFYLDPLKKIEAEPIFLSLIPGLVIQID